MPPTMIDRLKLVGDEEAANALCIIMSNEITHVSVGKRWFECMCGTDRLNPVSTWHSLVKRYFHGDLKPPFNIAARNAAHFSAAFYGPLATRDDFVASPEKMARRLALIANTRGKAGLDEIIKIAVKNALRIALFNIGAQILHHLIRMQNIRPDLVSPANIGFA